jgi:hypothetical protein
MKQQREAMGRAVWAVVIRAAGNPFLWGVIGWALLIFRYSSDVIHPRYGG